MSGIGMRSKSPSMIFRNDKPNVEAVIKKNQEASDELRIAASRWAISYPPAGNAAPPKASVKTTSRSATATKGRGP